MNVAGRSGRPGLPPLTRRRFLRIDLPDRDVPIKKWAWRLFRIDDLRWLANGGNVALDADREVGERDLRRRSAIADCTDVAPILSSAGRSPDTERTLMVYRRLFDPPGTVGMVTAGFIARLTVSMSSLGLVLALTATNADHGYATAGLVAGVFGLASSLLSPYVGRLIDEHGQRRILVPLALSFTVSMLALIGAIAGQAPNWVLLALAALAGASMPVCGPLIRTRWANLYGTSRMLRVSYALESVTDEIVYIVGPVLVAVIATSFGTSLGLLAVAACAAVGTLSLAVQTGTQPEPNRGGPGRRAPKVALVRNASLLVVCTALFGIGGALGALEIITVAYAELRQHKGWSGALLGLMGLASMVAGLAFGALRTRLDPARQLCATVVAFGLGLLPFWLVEGPVGGLLDGLLGRLVGGLGVLAVLLFCSGLVLAPAMISCMEAATRSVSRTALTEAMTWASAAIGLGLTAGSLAGGVLVDAVGPAAAFRAPVVFGLGAAFVVAAGYRSLSRTLLDHRITS
ncbi:MAG TPA: MFS transporter [Nocardioidaceae bacterium]|nr:MFS transporter [Nocardioidaceae bacterium]